MSGNHIPRPSQGTPPLVMLAAWLEKAHHRNDRVISFPANTSEAIRKARPSGAHYDMQEVQTIVLALEGRDLKLCERLDSLSLTILCSIFIYSQECLAQQRGLCLLAKALHRDEGDSAWEATHKQGKKMALGQAALTLLIKGFLKTDASDKLRRWLGILALELLENCPENTEKLQSDPPREKNWQYLSEVIEHGSCQVLKLLAGSMIRELLSFGMSPDNFWPSDTVYYEFPKGQHHNSQWVTSFEEFVDDLMLRKILTQEVSSVLFAQVVYVGDQKWDLEEASDILVTLSEELNIIVPAKDANPAVYIDVPLNSILEFSLDKAFVRDSQQPTYGLVIQLMDGVATNCILNATEYAERHVALGFASEKDANTLRRLLVSTNVRTNGFPPQSQSEAIDVSEPVLSDDELAAPGPALTKSQILMRTASLASAIIPHRDTVSTIDPSRLERVHTSQRASAEYQEGSSSSMGEHEEDFQRVVQSMEIAEEGIDVSHDGILLEQAIEGIGVSQIDGLSHEEEQHRDIQARAPNNAWSNARVHHFHALSHGTQEPMGRFDRTSDTGLSSSLRGQTSLEAIQNVPESRARLLQQAVSSVVPVENRTRPEDQNGEYDDLYDASPRVKDRQRRSPRIFARDNTPKRLERPLEPTAQQASVKTGLPTKLSKQLRNANGVVESRTEQTADDDFDSLTMNGAGDVKTSANSKKSQAPVQAKIRSVIKEPKKTTKKTAQTKGKAVAFKEPSKTSLDDYDLPPSPTHVESIIQTSVDKKKATTTRPKASKAPRNNQKQAKSMPTKATATTSSKGPTLEVRKGFKDKAKAKAKAKANGSVHDLVPNRPSGKKVDDDDDAIWDVDQAHSEEEPQTSRQSRQPAKTAKKQEVPVSKTERNKAQTQLHSDEAKANKATKAQTQAPRARVTKARPAPAALSQPRSRRTAAIKANKKIQGLEEFDDIVDDDEFVPALTCSNPNASSDAAKVPKNQKVRFGEDNQATSSGKLPTARLSAKDTIPDSISPHSSDEQRPDSVSNSKADSSPEKVDLLRDAPAKALRAAPGDTRDSLTEEDLTSAAETSVIPLHSGNGNHSNQLNPTSAEGVVEVSEVRVDLISGSVPQVYDSITETEPAPPRPQQNNDVKKGDLDATKQAGPGNQDQVEHVSPYINDLPLELNSKLDRVQEEVDRPTARKVVELRYRRTSPPLAKAAPKPLPKTTTARRDPFVAKLNALISESKNTNVKVKSGEGDANVESKGPNTPNPSELEKSSREPKASAFDELEATSFEEAKHVENPRRRLKSAMQVDGEGDSLIQTLKPARESTSASEGETKRKTEQVGKTSNKRVKMAPQERFEGASARRKPIYDTKDTPPPVVSKKPLVIGFSKNGPRNQGIVSTKKPKPPTHVGTGAPGALETRKHDVPNPTISQVETGFAPVRQVLEQPSKAIEHGLDGAQKKAGGSSQRKQPEHPKTVNTVATREANTQEHLAHKRKLAPFLDEPPAPWEHEQLLKRQKRDIETPPTAQNHHPKMLPDLSPAVIHDRSQRFSSQNTRVNENGSPMPFLITRNEEIAAEEQYSDEDDGKNALAEARLEDQIVSQNDDPIFPEPTLPLRALVPAQSISQPKTTTHESLYNNSKQVPSSPHAPSGFSTMPPHHIYHDGEIVNAETKELIIPVKPQDPFLGATQNPQNSFMNALRKSTEVAAKRLISGANDKRGSGGAVVRPSLNVGEDPDKTLVEPKLRKKYKRVLVSASSSSSQSGSSIQASQPDDSSEEESDGETEAKWRKGLEPHQENMLQCLQNISHRLIRHLIDKETAIKDMVTDYANRGNNLVERYERGLQDYIDLQRANNDRRHQNLTRMFEKAQADRATTFKAVVNGSIQDMKKRWEMQQEALQASLAAAYAACAD